MLGICEEHDCAAVAPKQSRSGHTENQGSLFEPYINHNRKETYVQGNFVFDEPENPP